MSRDHLSESLRKNGWAASTCCDGAVSILKDRVLEISGGLGNVVPGLGGALVETIAPRSQENARPASLSRKFGYGALPLHCETAHWIVPCRYIVLGCLEVGCVDTPTILLDGSDLDFSNEERLLARSATFLVRNGARSFYASLIDNHRAFVRIDPGCMEPIGGAGVEAMALYCYERHRRKAVSFSWNTGEILIIDNWRVLHGRGNRQPADLNRRLLRAYVQ